MKKIILVITSLLGLKAFALSTVSCDSLDGSAQVTMQISSTNKVSSLRLQKDNTSAQSFFARFIQSTSQTSTYSLSGTSDLLKIDNTITDYSFGRAEIGKMIFSCN